MGLQSPVRVPGCSCVCGGWWVPPVPLWGGLGFIQGEILWLETHALPLAYSLNLQECHDLALERAQFSAELIAICLLQVRSNVMRELDEGLRQSLLTRRIARLRRAQLLSYFLERAVVCEHNREHRFSQGPLVRKSTVVEKYDAEQKTE